jgi:hypothetical protein
MKTIKPLWLLNAAVLGFTLLAAADAIAATNAAGGSATDPAGAGAAAGGQSDPCSDRNNRKICRTFETSLHKTRVGKPRHYNAEYGGFEALTGVDYDTLACKGCHDPLNGTTPVPYEPSCFDCHRDTDQDADSNAFNDKVPEATCLGCHSRQNAEKTMLTDVHRALGMVCMDCHSKQEMHGDGTAYESLEEPGALKVSCTQAGCHNTGDLTTRIGKGNGKNRTQVGVSARAVEFHSQHLATTDCSACHVQSVVACDSCHFDSEVVGKKRYYRQIPQTGFKFLMNKDGKVRTATYQALTWGSSDPAVDDVSFYVLAPYVAHSIGDGTGTGTGPKVTCEDCHVYEAKAGSLTGNAALISYLDTGSIQANRWEPETVDDGNANTHGKLLAPVGTIPVPPDWQDALLFDFVKWTNDPSATVVKDPTAAYWDFLKSGADMVHMPYGSPLSEDQIGRLILKD